MLGGFEIKFLDPVSLDHGHPGLLLVARVDQHAHCHSIHSTRASSSPRRMRALEYGRPRGGFGLARPMSGLQDNMVASAACGRPVAIAGRSPPGTPSPERRRVSLGEKCHIQRQPGLPAHAGPAEFQSRHDGRERLQLASRVTSGNHNTVARQENFAGPLPPGHGRMRAWMAACRADRDFRPACSPAAGRPGRAGTTASPSRSTRSRPTNAARCPR